MDNNLKIIEDINKQREANRLLKQAIQAHIGRIRQIAQAQIEANQKLIKQGLPPAITLPSPMEEQQRATSANAVDPLYLLERNRLKIAALRGAIVELETRVAMQKSYSREMLPPMDGVQTMYGVEEWGGAVTDDLNEANNQVQYSK